MVDIAFKKNWRRFLLLLVGVFVGLVVEMGLMLAGLGYLMESSAIATEAYGYVWLLAAGGYGFLCFKVLKGSVKQRAVWAISVPIVISVGAYVVWLLDPLPASTDGAELAFLLWCVVHAVGVVVAIFFEHRGTTRVRHT